MTLLRFSSIFLALFNVCSQKGRNTTKYTYLNWSLLFIYFQLRLGGFDTFNDLEWEGKNELRANRTNLTSLAMGLLIIVCRSFDLSNSGVMKFQTISMIIMVISRNIGFKEGETWSFYTQLKAFGQMLAFLLLASRSNMSSEL